MAMRSLSEYEFARKLELLTQSRRVNEGGYRVFGVPASEKIYFVVSTENGVFGTKLLPSVDWRGDREAWMRRICEEKRHPIEYLRDECGVKHWDWVDVFQSRRSLDLLGMNK